MEKRNKLIYIAAVFLFVALVSAYNFPLNKQTIPSRFVVGENMGFDLDPGKLNFGQIVPGYSASRQIMVDNTFDKPILVNIKSSGELSKYVIVSENNFVLEPSQSKNITFSAFADRSLDYGEYSGQIIITSKRNFFGL